MNIDITDPQGKLPEKTAELVAAFFPYFDIERAAEQVGVSAAQARTVFGNEAVKQIVGAVTAALLDDVARNGRRLVPLDDDLPVKALLSGAWPESMTHDDWIRSGRLDEPVKNRESRAASA